MFFPLFNVVIALKGISQLIHFEIIGANLKHNKILKEQRFYSYSLFQSYFPI
jgi:hypothetical protein